MSSNIQHWLSKFFKVFQNDSTALVANEVDSMKDAFNQSRAKSLQHSICFAPSVNMVFSQDGTVKACCHNSENLLGRYPEQSIHEIWNSTEAKAFRMRMSEYRLLSGCGVCANDYNSQNFEEMPARHFDTIPQHPQYPTMMEFLLSNTCNLECVMCNGELSSSIRKNRDKLPAINSPYDQTFVNQLQEFIPHLIETRFSGAGEAFLIDTNFRIWEMLMETNPECLIVVQTNGTVLNARVKDFLQRGNFKIGVSLDSLKKESYESIRLNASYERVMENVRYFSEYSKEHKRTFTISTCVMRDNWKELPDFVRFCNDIEANATFHKVWSPSEHGLYNLPPEELEIIHAELLSVQLPSTSPIEKKNKNHYHYFVSVIENWLNNARNRNTVTTGLPELTTGELLDKAKQVMKAHLVSETMLETDKQLLIHECETKVDEMMKLCVNENEKRSILLAICSMPIASTVAAIKRYTPEKLYEMSAGYTTSKA